jgi:hypothetical protein
MIIFIPQDENKSCIIEKKNLNFLFILYIFLFFFTIQFERLSLNFCVLVELRRKSGETPVKIQKKIVSLLCKYGKWKYAFYFINISQYFIYKYMVCFIFLFLYRLGLVVCATINGKRKNGICISFSFWY